MRLIASLMALTKSPAALALPLVLVLGVSACAGNSPRKPTAATDKSSRTTLADRCIEAENRNQPPPSGCENTRATARNRPLPGLQDDPLLSSPTLPGVGLPSAGGGLLRR